MSQTRLYESNCLLISRHSANSQASFLNSLLLKMSSTEHAIVGFKESSNGSLAPGN